MAGEKEKWIRASRRQHCPICDRPDWCLISPDGAAVICMRSESAKPIDCKGAGQGWLHRLSDPIPPPPKPKPRPARSLSAVEQYLALPDMAEDQITALGASLGVSMPSLRRLGVRWSFEHHAAAFPMRDWQGEIVGVRLRSNDGGKWAVRGSKSALFIPDGEVGDMVTELWVCEGPTDCAALLDLGVYAIGRPSCSGGTELVLPLAVGRNVVIMADADEAKTRPDGTTWKPGQAGAEALAKALPGKARTVRLVYPLVGKDVRQWLQAGITGPALLALAANTRECRK